MRSLGCFSWPRLVTLLLVLYWIAILTATHLPEVPSVALARQDKMAHYVAYAGLAFLLSWAWTSRGRDFLPRGMLFALAVATLYGAVDELTQIPVPGRFGDWYDWLADMIGALTGTVVFAGAAKMYRRVCHAHSVVR